jgi:8-oxo-dGTP diphosphatase
MYQSDPASFSCSPQLELEIRVVIFSLREDRLQTLLVFNLNNLNTWEIPGMPVHVGLSLEQIANQCLTSYLGEREVYLEQLYTYGCPMGFPERSCVSVVYFAIIPSDAFPIYHSEQTNVNWFPLDSLPDMFVNHGEILSYALRRLRYKLEYTAIGFELLPENFSLSELQKTYEMILGETLDKRNFRRRILNAKIIEPTLRQRLGEGRPARLFRYRPDSVAEVKARRLFP